MFILFKVCIVFEGANQLLYQKALRNVEESVR